jgi:hypothetical protein
LFHVAPRDELLGALETTNSNQEGYALHVLPGRYAFVLKIAPRSVAGLVRTVAQK